MVSHSSCLAWEILWTEEPGKLTVPGGHKELDTTEHIHMLLTIATLTKWRHGFKIPARKSELKEMSTMQRICIQ